ncbi:MAG: SUF system NifU family Fe-S cluster assembly protein [Acidobacteriota bacterium]
MSDLGELYQELIVGHSKKPRNFRKIEGADHQAEGYNPLCGDKITVYLKLKDDVVQEIGFQGSGCAISTASASLMTERAKGKTRAEAEALFDVFHKLVTEGPAEEIDTAQLGKLAVFSGVCEYPTRVKCATLAWHTLRAAFQGAAKSVSTE